MCEESLRALELCITPHKGFTVLKRVSMLKERLYEEYNVDIKGDSTIWLNCASFTQSDVGADYLCFLI